MKQKSLIVTVAALAALLAIGCGGTGNGVGVNGLTTGSTGINNPFAGSYVGQWMGTIGLNSGTMNLTVDSGGNLGGTFQANGATGKISGSVTNTGDLIGQVTFPSGEVDNLIGTIMEHGTTITGSLQEQGMVNMQINITVSEPANANSGNPWT